MGIREALQKKPAAGIAVGALMILGTGLLLAHNFWPEKKADLSRAYYSDDDGKTWFKESAYLVPPFDHGGKQAVVAHVYTYANGSKEMCGYLARFTTEGKKRLEESIAEATRAGKPPGAAALYGDRKFMTEQVEVKKPGAAEWVRYNDPRANEVFTVRSPDGSVVDEALVY